MLEIQELKSHKEFQETFQIKSVSTKLKTCKVLNDPKKQELLEKLLAKWDKELEKLLNS